MKYSKIFLMFFLFRISHVVCFIAQHQYLCFNFVMDVFAAYLAHYVSP